MKIVINAFSARRGGGQTYLLNLLQYVDEAEDAEIYLLASDSLPVPQHARIKRLLTKWPTENPLMRSVFEKMFLPGLLKKIGADILFCPGGLINTIPPKGCRTVTMFRNMTPFDYAQRAKYPYGLMRARNWILEKKLLESMLSADLVIFISEHARSVIEQRAGKSLTNAVTILHGLSEQFKITDAVLVPRPDWLPHGEYLLYVSIFDIYKNQLEIVRGFNLLKKRRKTAEKLVLAGHNSTSYGKKVREEIFRLGLMHDIILPGNIPYNDLPGLYHHAKINIFASECENCPNILLEALGAGRPLVVSNRPPMPEFGKDAVNYFDPSSAEDFADKIVTLIDNPASMNEMAGKAKLRSHCFSWEKTAHLTWKAILTIK